MNLLIVESPGKIKKIEAYAGPDFKVMASVGHIRDLPPKDLGVSPPDYRPRYEATTRGREVITKLRAAAKKADKVYLATDPDREGEAIAWHLAEALDLKDPLRVTFHEITESAVKAAIANPRVIDRNLVYAQEGRRVLDRLVGYQVSPIVSSRLRQSGLSAGRVQSPALRLVVEREQAIKSFKMTSHFGVEIEFEAVENVKDGWKTQWNPKKDWLEGDQEFFLDENKAREIAALKNWTVASYQESESKQAPPAPFTTSTLQQAASNALKLDPKRTMELAQRLYEQSFITYMRTDSPNLSDEAIAEIRSLAAQNDWPVPATPRKWASKDGAQEAHEAIRPTSFTVEDAGESPDEKALYQLIRIRALASQLMETVYAVTAVALESELDGKKVVCEAQGRSLISPGWRVVLTGGDQAAEPDEDPEPDNAIPKLREGSQPVAIGGRVLSKKTRPPARFTQASLVKKLEDMGIGRPSTYAAILDNLISRAYVKEDKRQLAATDLGVKIIEALAANFGFTDYGFTKSLEAKLDEIAQGQADYQRVVGSVAELLDKELAGLVQSSGLACPDCGRTLCFSEKHGFWFCPGFKNGDCSAKFQDDHGKPGQRKEKKDPPPLTDFKCPKCGKPLARLTGTGAKGPYDFFGCSDRTCKQSFSVKEDGTPEFEKKERRPLSNHKCPKCSKALVRLQGSGAKGAYDFYKCSSPDCKQTLNPLANGDPDYDGAKNRSAGKGKNK